MVDLRSDSSPLSKVRPSSLPARQCTSGSTTGVTCSASPAIEPAVAIAFEESGGSGHHHEAEPTTNDATAAAEVPRSLQSTAGLLTATMVGGVTLGGLVGVIGALALGRLGRLGVRDVSLAVAAIGFVSVSVMPFVAYPPNPPAVGHHETIGIRTELYFIMLAISIIAAVAAVLVGRRLAARLGAWYATLSAIAGNLLVPITAIALLPTYSEVPADFPAAVLYEFWMVSLATQLSLWATIGLALGELLHRRQHRTDLQLTAPGYTEQSF
jgi:predicted cobalt transporter CbtA